MTHVYKCGKSNFINHPQNHYVLIGAMNHPKKMVGYGIGFPTLRINGYLNGTSRIYPIMNPALLIVEFS